MAKIIKSEKKDNIPEMLEKSRILKIGVESEMKKSFISYAMAVNVSRAIPDVRDGLKPVHRRVLYAMNELGLTSDKPYRKCARIVGDVLGKYHPHGDSAVYDTLVRMAQDFSMRKPLVDGQGNFGSVDGDPAAAQRYTEAKMSKIAAEMIREIDKNTVDYYPNFDDTLMQPVVLPSRYPNLLVNGSEGIAVGMATSIPPHNLGEVINGTIALLDNPDIDIDELIEYIPAPDYPTAALIMGRSGIKKAYRTGRGNAILRARTEIEEFNNGTRQRIVVTELPYQVNKAKLIENIADLVKTKKIEGISDLREESDREGMRIVVDVKKDSNASVVLNMLFKHTSMQISHSIIMLALIEGTPRVLNIKEILSAYVAHQKDVIVRRTKYDLDKALERAHILEGLIKALDNIDEVIHIIRSSKDNAEATVRLIETFDLSDKQAAAILEMKLRRLTGLEAEKISAELNVLIALIEDYKEILGSDARVIEIIKTELTEIKVRYDDPRRSELSYNYDDIDIEDLIEREDVVVSMTHQGYIKRQAVSEYKAQRRGGVGISAHKTKDEDFVEEVFKTNTHDYLMFFTNTGRVYRIKGYQVPEASRNAKGRAIVNVLNLADGERISAFMPLKEDAEGYLMLATAQGLVKKTAIEEFKRIQSNGKIAIKLNEGDELISAILTGGEDELIIASSGGKCIRFSESHVRAMGRTGHGVKSIKLDKSERVVDMSMITDGAEVLSITENGYGKRSDVSEYRLQSRNGTGVKLGNLTEKTGNIVNLKVVDPKDDLMIITENGTVIRINADSISKTGRTTQGVKVMRLRDDNVKVVGVAVVPRCEETEDGADDETKPDVKENTELEGAENE